MGPSGSGKTTLLNLIAGIDTPSEGNVWVEQELISDMSEGRLAHWRTKHVGFIFHSITCCRCFRLMKTSNCRSCSWACRRPSAIGKLQLRWSSWGWQIARAIAPDNFPAASSSAWGIARAIVNRPGLDRGRRADGRPRRQERRGNSRPAGRAFAGPCIRQSSWSRTIPRRRRADRVLHLEKANSSSRP